jgi:hypothetical protein
VRKPNGFEPSVGLVVTKGEAAVCPGCAGWPRPATGLGVVPAAEKAGGWFKDENGLCPGWVCDVGWLGAANGFAVAADGCGAEKPENDDGVVVEGTVVPNGELEAGRPKGEEVVAGGTKAGLAMDKSLDSAALATNRLPPSSENRLSGLFSEVGGFSDGSSKMVL